MRATRTIACLILLGALAQAEPETLRLGWGHSWTAYYKQSQFKAYRNPPEGVEELEEEDLWYVAIELAPGKVLLVAAQTESKPPRAWIDLDFDGRLKDEEPIELTGSLSKFQTTVELGWRDGKEDAPHGYVYSRSEASRWGMVEIVSGLDLGEQLIISDTARFEGATKVLLRR